eukprot:1750985-Pyramimonas_sp.AAC.1
MCTWLHQALPRGGKQVHAYLKAEVKVHVEYFETRSGVVCDPVAMMKHREQFWGNWWTPDPQVKRCLNAGLGELRALAQLSLVDVEPLEMEDISRACVRFAEGAAVGVDQWSP